MAQMDGPRHILAEEHDNRVVIITAYIKIVSALHDFVKPCATQASVYPPPTRTKGGRRERCRFANPKAASRLGALGHPLLPRPARRTHDDRLILELRNAVRDAELRLAVVR